MATENLASPPPRFHVPQTSQHCTGQASQNDGAAFPIVNLGERLRAVDKRQGVGPRGGRGGEEKAQEAAACENSKAGTGQGPETGRVQELAGAGVQELQVRPVSGCASRERQPLTRA